MIQGVARLFPVRLVLLVAICQKSVGIDRFAPELSRFDPHGPRFPSTSQAIFHLPSAPPYRPPGPWRGFIACSPKTCFHLGLGPGPALQVCSPSSKQVGSASAPLTNGPPPSLLTDLMMP